MNEIRDIPEIRGLEARSGLVRIPDQIDVPLTPRVRRLIDTAAFRRLAKISQLGLVWLVYPAAGHSRFEHSLGVYRLALDFVRQLAADPRFARSVAPEDVERLIAASLLHDVGHWPFCHLIEDMQLPDVPDHEQFAKRFLHEDEVAGLLRRDWNLSPESVLSLLSESSAEAPSSILKSILSGPIDIDKMDYLVRDSLHAGVPYGRNFDRGRLIGSLCLGEDGRSIAVTEKGRTAAEMMVFARYVMFSEVYWHHAVRSATAMLQRTFYTLKDRFDLNELFLLTESEFIERLRSTVAGEPAAALVEGLFGRHRLLYKRRLELSIFQQEPLYRRLAGRPYPWLVAKAEQLAARLSERIGRPVAPTDILIDAPPVRREVQFHVDVYYSKERCWRPFGEVSPVVQTLARKQFDDYVKRVRVYVHPRLAALPDDPVGRWCGVLLEDLCTDSVGRPGPPCAD